MRNFLVRLSFCMIKPLFLAIQSGVDAMVLCLCFFEIPKIIF